MRFNTTEIIGRGTRAALALAVSVTMVAGMAACGQAQNEPAAQDEPAAKETAIDGASYTYEGIEAWDVINEETGTTMKEDTAFLAKPELDMDAFVASPLGEMYLNNTGMAGMDIAGEEIQAYWVERGMVHEAHDVDDADRQWTSLVPASIDLNGDKTYPLLFVWHGYMNPIAVAEGYGFAEEAAEREWIVVVPWADNDNLYLEEFDRILAYMEESYPVDASRVYSTGFSKGGRTSANLAVQRQDVLAAVACCGCNASARFLNPDGTIMQVDGDQHELTAVDFEGVEAKVPAMFFGGQYDGFSVTPYDANWKVDAVNLWLNHYGIDNPQTLEESTRLLDSADDPAKSAIGLDFDTTKTLDLEDTTYQVGGFNNADGVEVLQIVQAQDALHWPTPNMAGIAMDFLEQFSL